MQKYLEKLEYYKVLEILTSHTTTYSGKALALSLLPCKNKSDALYSLQETTEAITLLYRKSNPPLFDIPNIEEHLKILSSSGVLSCQYLLDLANILKLSRNLKEYSLSDDVDTSSLYAINKYFNTLYSNKSLESQIFACIVDENTIDDNASTELKNIRKNQKKLTGDIKDKLNSFVHSSTYSKYLQDNIITIRSDRYVIPVKQEYRSMVKGFIHDISSTGSTVFIEPMSVFELNNSLNQLRLEENIEIEKILQKLSGLFFELVHELEANINLISKIDLIFAKAKFALATNSTLPEICENKFVNLIKARHPLIDKNTVVPIDINIGKDFQTLIITGPNTGGKTVTLKTVGLLALMAMSGLYIPANEHSSIYMFDNVFADIGDEQSITESLSTFSSHIKNIIEILEKSTPNSLVLLDELGSGTDPIQGAALGISILEYLHSKNVLTLATTHYTEIKNYALVTAGFENASSEFNIESLSPTYKIIIGVPGKSMAFDISQKLGLDEKILLSAKQKLDSSHVNIEELLKSIYDDKALIELEKDKILKESKKIEELRTSLEKDNTSLKDTEKELINKAKSDAREILIEAKQDADRIIKEITNSENRNANKLRVELNEKIKKLSTVDASKNQATIPVINIQPGIEVYIHKLNGNATVLTMPNKSNEVQIQIGNIKTNVNITELSISKSELKNEKQISKKRTNFEIKSISPEINVIGKNIEEANIEIDKYLDTAFLNGLSQVTIVHGKGTGALRTGIHKFLKDHKHVKSYRLGIYGEGEAGVTVVLLK